MRADQLASLAPEDILPVRHAREVAAITTPFAVLESWQLSSRHTLAVLGDAAGRRFAVPLVTVDGRVRRARAGDGASAALAAVTTGTGGFRLQRYVEPTGGAHERAIDVDQTNESVVVDERLVVKWTVRASGAHLTPARFATLARAGYLGTPRPHAVLQWQPPDGGPHELVATVVEYVPGARDGWEWAVEDLRAYLAGGIDLDAATAFGAPVGALVRGLHEALATDGIATATPADSARWRDDALTELDAALAAVPDGPLHTHEPTVRAALRQLALDDDTPIGSVHGDLHIGQILRTGAGSAGRYLVTDFDGNPVAPDNGAAQPVAVDVAGLVQSIDHVGRVVRHHDPSADPVAVRRWTGLAQRSFLDACRSEAVAAGLLLPLQFRQVVREYLYAVRHLPGWQYVPDDALPDLVRQWSERVQYGTGTGLLRG